MQRTKMGLLGSKDRFANLIPNTMKSLNWLTRKLHRWGAIITAIPLLIVVLSGLLLQVKKQLEWVQPPSQKSDFVASEFPVALENLLAVAQKVAEADVHSWDDVDRIDIRPRKGIAKIQCKNRWELQIDLTTNDVLSSEYRRSDLIESLHDGSFFSDSAKLWLFLPNGLILLGLWGTGMWLWYLPISTRRKKKQRMLRSN
ncbi:MAG: PepSY-associated TM helix domain-containing protein [Fuerstiella sp.]